MTVCGAVYPKIASSLNHSCHPNLIRITAMNKLVLVAARNIDSGKQRYNQIFNSVSTNYIQYQNMSQRQDHMTQTLSFKLSFIFLQAFYGMIFFNGYHS